MNKYSVVKRTRCPECSSKGRDINGDNLVSYSDGGQYCFACKYTNQTNKTNRTRREVKVNTEEREMQEINDVKFLEGVYRDLNARLLTEETCRFFDYSLCRMDRNYGSIKANDYVQVANYRDKKNRLVAQKVRDRNKNMVFIKSKSTNPPLFGMSLWKSHEKIPIVVTEGEIDALTVAQATDYRLPVVSVPNGAAGAYKSIKENLEYLLGFKYVILAFDNDDAGLKSMEECIELFEPHKLRLVKWVYKDANDILKEQGPKAIRDNIYKASCPAEDGIVRLEDVIDQVLDVKTADFVLKDWPILNDAMHGLRRGELTTLMAGAGLGKTEVITEIVHQLVRDNQTNVGIMSFEQAPKKTYKRILGKSLEKRLDIESDIDTKELINSVNYDKEVYCYDKSGRVSWSDVRIKIQHYVKGLDCGVIVIDNLSNIAATFDDDERRGIDKAMLELSSIAIDFNVHIFLVCHVSRPSRGSTPFDRGRELSLSDARGSESIGQHSSYVFGLERNALSEDEKIRTTSILRCLKDREYGTARGMKFFFRFDFDTGLLQEVGKPIIEADMVKFFEHMAELDLKENYILKLTYESTPIDLYIEKPEGVNELYYKIYVPSEFQIESEYRDKVSQLIKCSYEKIDYTAAKDILLLKIDDIGSFISHILENCSEVILEDVQNKEKYYVK